jgi:hypothetical protein
MLSREIIAVYCENNMEHINIISEQNSELLNVKENDTYNIYYRLKGKSKNWYDVWWGICGIHDFQSR